MAEYENASSNLPPTTFADLLRDHPEAVSGQAADDPYSNNEAKNDLNRPLHPRR